MELPAKRSKGALAIQSQATSQHMHFRLYSQGPLCTREDTRSVYERSPASSDLRLGKVPCLQYRTTVAGDMA